MNLNFQRLKSIVGEKIARFSRLWTPVKLHFGSLKSRVASKSLPSTVTTSFSPTQALARPPELSEARLQELRELFTTIDQNGDGEVTAKEMTVMMKSLGHNTSEADVEEMIKPYDWDGSKTIDFSEFISLMTPKIIELDAQEAHLKVIPGDKELESPVAEPDFHPVPALTPSGTTSTAVTNSTTRRTRVKSTRTKAVERDRDIKEAFKVLDQNGDGFISAAEVKQVLHNFGDSFSDTDIVMMLREADADADGRVSFPDFESMMRRR